jgi:hypothetical protein
MNEPKNAFDFSGASIWTRDKKLGQINIGKINGSKNREKMRFKEIPNHQKLTLKSKNGKS